MTESTRTFTISLPVELAQRVDKACDEAGALQSEFVGEAVRRHLRECAWDELFRYGEERARELGIGPGDVERLIEDYRDEVASLEQ